MLNKLEKEISKIDQLDLSVTGELNISDYIRDVPPSEKVSLTLLAWKTKNAEDAKRKVLLSLTSVFGGSVVFSSCLIFLASINNNVDKLFVEKSVQALLTCQSGLVGTAYGGYLLYSYSQRKSRQ